MQKMETSKIVRWSAIVTVSVFLATFVVNGDPECEQLLQGNHYLAQSTLQDVFNSFREIFGIVYNSDLLQSRLEERSQAVRFAELIVIGKRIELELKAMDEKKLNQTISDLCNELPSNDLWLKCTNVVLRTEYELRSLLKQAMYEPTINYRPRPG